MTNLYTIDPAVPAAVRAFRAPDELGFGIVPAPVMFSAEYRDGEWQAGELLPFGPIELLPNSRVVQFAESVFEGMKAYVSLDGVPHLFRPERNAARIRASAERIGMPEVPEEIFLRGCALVAAACRDIIPRVSGSSLYMRPTLLATEPGYTVFNSKRFRFLVLASPSGGYSSGNMKVWIERNDVRAARGGIGFAKTGGNYAAAMRSTSRAIEKGFTVSLWLDPHNRETIEELSGMNLFALIDGELHTPALSDSILSGVTRDSVITLARSQGYVINERLMPIGELLADIQSGRCTELFATGTAAIVTPIERLGDDEKRFELTTFDTSLKIREALLAIQERRSADSFGWTWDLPADIAAKTIFDQRAAVT